MGGGLGGYGSLGQRQGLDTRTPWTLHFPPILTLGKMPFLFLIFVLKELFQFLVVPRVKTTVRLWIKGTQPSSPSHLVAMVLQKLHFLLGKGCHGDRLDSMGRVESSQHSRARRAHEAAHGDIDVSHPWLAALEAVFVYSGLGELPYLAGAYLLVVPMFSVRHSVWCLGPLPPLRLFVDLTGTILPPACKSGEPLTTSPLHNPTYFSVYSPSRPHYKNDYAAHAQAI